MEALLYTRVSREEQVKFGFSLEAQLESLKKYCEENHLKIRSTYSDEGISGGSITKRKSFQKMINDAQDGDIILFTKLDRFSRNLLDANIIIKQLEEKNVSIKAINEDDIDTSTADGKFIFNLKLSLAQREREKVSERISDVFEYKIKNGFVVSGKVPYGYEIVDGKFKVVEKEAEEIRALFDHFIKYNSITDTTTWWNDNHPDHIRHPDNIRNSKLKNKFYLGIHPSGLNDQFCEPIVSQEQFDEVQKIFDCNRNIKEGKKNGEVYLFNKLMSCPRCGRSMSGMYSTLSKYPNHKYKFYRCNCVYRDKYHRTCDFKHSISESKIEKAALEGLIQKANEVATVVLEPNTENITDLNQQLIKNKDKIKRLKDLYIDGLLTKDEFDEKYKSLQSAINLLQTSLNKEDENMQTNKAVELKNIDIKTLYNKLTPENKRVFWRKYINRIEIDEETLKISVVYQ